MKRIIGAIFGLFLSAQAQAQYLTPAVNSNLFPSTPSAGMIPQTSSPTAADWVTVTAALDAALASTRGAIIERGSGGWTAFAPGTIGKPLVSGGAGTDPAYQTLGIVGGGTNCAAASGTCLDNITGFATTGLISRTGAGTYSFTTPAAATQTNDTNVTLTLSGTPATALLQAVGFTMGWSGQLAIGRGGTGAATQATAILNLLPTPTRAGDIPYYNGTNIVFLAGNNSGTACFQENASGVPSFAPCASGAVTSVNTATGAVTLLTEPQGRLTLQANTPVMTTTQAAQTTVRYDCYIGNQVPYYTGSADAVDTVASCEVTDAMVSAASAGQVVNANVYDVWWVHGGANRICIAMSVSTGGGGGWSADTAGSNTARGTGYSQLDFTTRPYITNKNSIANCFNGATNYGPVSANQGTYLGTIFSTANGQTAFQFGSANTSGQNAVLGVFNAYNKGSISTAVNDTTASWSYTILAFRQANASASNQIQLVDGLGTIFVNAEYGTNSSVGTGGGVATGVGLDSTTTASGRISFINASTSGDGVASYRGTVGSGLHTLAALEKGNGSAASTFFGGTPHSSQLEATISGM